MATDALQSNGTSYASRPIAKAPEWHGLVAFDLLFNNLATGIFLAAALAELAAPELFSRLAKAAYPLALASLIIDLACLVLDLGDPLRFHHMLRVFKPSSPMSLGTWCLTIYSFPLALAAGLSILPSLSPTLEWIRKAAVVIAILPALGSALYKGVLLSTNSQPGWRDARWMGAYLTNSAFLLGCAGMLVLAALLGQMDAVGILRPALLLLLLLNAVPLALLISDLRPAWSQHPKARYLGWLTAAGVGGGTVLPLGLLLAGPDASPQFAPVLLLLAGSLALRFMIVRVPHAIG
jgi:hypothetical protein